MPTALAPRRAATTQSRIPWYGMRAISPDAARLARRRRSSLAARRALFAAAVDAVQEAVEAALEDDVAGEREIAPGGQLNELEDAAVEGGHGAVGRDEIEIGLKQIEQVERAERQAARRDAHGEERQPGRPMKQAVEKLQKQGLPPSSRGAQRRSDPGPPQPAVSSRGLRPSPGSLRFARDDGFVTSDRLPPLGIARRGGRRVHPFSAKRGPEGPDGCGRQE